MLRKSKPSGQLWRVDLSAVGIKIRVGNNDPQLWPGQVTSMTRVQPSLLVLMRDKLLPLQVNLMTGGITEEPRKPRKPAPTTSPTVASSPE